MEKKTDEKTCYMPRNVLFGGRLKIGKNIRETRFDVNVLNDVSGTSMKNEWKEASGDRLSRWNIQLDLAPFTQPYISSEKESCKVIGDGTGNMQQASSISF